MKKNSVRFFVAALFIGLINHSMYAGQPDPFAGNNTIYPPVGEWERGFRVSNYNYPSRAVEPKWTAGGPNGEAKGGLSKENAPSYISAVKSFLEEDIKGLVNDPMKWSPVDSGWFDMPWGGQGTAKSNGEIDPESGRESLMATYTGQILQPDVYPSDPPSKAFQNHALVYYNDVSAAMLGKVWKNVFEPDLSKTKFPEGSIVVKVEGVTLSPDEWKPVEGSSLSYIYRPLVLSIEHDPNPKPVITELRFLQMAVKIKDKIASPETGWVFIAFAYNKDAEGSSAWDRAVPVGAMWGNDPEYNRDPNGLPAGKELMETWVNPVLPPFMTDGLGWGGRLAGPLDVGVRHNVVTISGKRPPRLPASSCVSCHSSAQYPFVANLYPSPNMVFPEEGNQFLFYDPGSSQWAGWFENRPGDQAMSGKGHKGIISIDYDMMLTFALMTANGSADTDQFVRHKRAGH